MGSNGTTRSMPLQFPQQHGRKNRRHRNSHPQDRRSKRTRRSQSHHHIRLLRNRHPRTRQRPHSRRSHTHRLQPRTPRQFLAKARRSRRKIRAQTRFGTYQAIATLESGRKTPHSCLSGVCDRPSSAVFGPSHASGRRKQDL